MQLKQCLEKVHNIESFYLEKIISKDLGFLEKLGKEKQLNLK